jgi:hypothetical protein
MSLNQEASVRTLVVSRWAWSFDLSLANDAGEPK